MLAPAPVITRAGYTAADQAENDDTTAPGIFAEKAKTNGAGVVRYLADYVFGDAKGAPHTKNDAPGPLDGRLKQALMRTNCAATGEPSGMLAALPNPLQQQPMPWHVPPA